MGLLVTQEKILQVVSRSWDIRSLEGYILPQCFTLPIDALKVPVVSPYVVGRSPGGRRGSLLTSSSRLRGSWRRRTRIGCGGWSAAISFLGRFGGVGEGDLVPWSEHTIRCFWSVPEMMRHGCNKIVGLSLLGLGRTVNFSL